MKHLAYKPGNSLIHNIDPRGKVILFVLFVISATFTNIENILSVLLLVSGLLTIILATDIPILHYLRRFLKFYLMIFVVTVFLPFLNESNNVILTIGGVNIYEEGVLEFLNLNIKLSLILFSSITLISTTTFPNIVSALEEIRLPKVVTSVIYLTNRFIEILSVEAQRQYLAFQSRYIYLSPYSRLIILAKAMSMFFIRTIERSDRIYLGMIARGFNGQIPKATKLAWDDKDTIAVTIGLVFLLFVWIANG
ncbi:MAG: hypothetical protein A2V66_14640 [Ignavibacteria bacterium RBG_13_36_8]|nr:MAG: hypothetical protein A2V66_14640 [Ignavibacteria bacterium RBG_13_36_8]